MDKPRDLPNGLRRYPASFAADCIGVARQTLNRWVREGTVPPLLPMPGHPGQFGWLKADIMIVAEWHEGRITSDEMFAVSTRTHAKRRALKQAHYAEVVPELARELGIELKPGVAAEDLARITALYQERKAALINARESADLL